MKLKCTYLDGSFYEGSWVDDMREGKREYHSKDGFVYMGDWSNDLRHGMGSTSKVDSNEVLVSP